MGFVYVPCHHQETCQNSSIKLVCGPESERSRPCIGLFLSGLLCVFVVFFFIRIYTYVCVRVCFNGINVFWLLDSSGTGAGSRGSIFRDSRTFSLGTAND